ncbi:MAG: 3-dehydroquinate synthase [Bryobacteraceae bacterium]
MKEDGRFPSHGTTVDMPVFRVETANRNYEAIVERGALRKLQGSIPDSNGATFVVTTREVWALHGGALARALDGRPHHVLYFAGGEPNKRVAHVESMAEQMVELGADRSSIVIAFGGGIVTDLAGFLAAIFMRGVPVIQIPTTLLAQVDAAVGGKTGANLRGGKNLIGAFHQPLVVLIDPDLLATLSEREYRAGLYEIIKCGIIRDAELFRILSAEREAVLSRRPDIEETIIAAAVRIKCEVVTADEREGDLRRILNFGHTVGHAIEAETKYETLLHGEAVAYGMHAAVEISKVTGLTDTEAKQMRDVIASYGPLPQLNGIRAGSLASLMLHDKKTVKGKVHFVLTPRVGETKIVSGIPESVILDAIEAAIR